MINQAACQEILWICDRDVKISLVKFRESFSWVGPNFKRVSWTAKDLLLDEGAPGL